MEKVNEAFIKKQYQLSVDNYTNYTTTSGLWQSEKYVFEKYLKKEDQILDLGCGTGRTTFPLYTLGYEKIRGLDLTPEMIAAAIRLNEHYDTTIPFEVGNAMKMRFEDNHFDSILFSFNGIMTIPGKANRTIALKEINRVLKKSGLFLFTTHDRDRAKQFLLHWEGEKIRWSRGIQNTRLYEYGDLIAKSRNEQHDIYIHFPSKREVEEWLIMNGYNVIETFYSIDKFKDSEAVLKYNSACRFWIAQKVN